MIDWFIYWLIEQMIDLLIAWLIIWLVDWLMDSFNNELMNSFFHIYISSSLQMWRMSFVITRYKEERDLWFEITLIRFLCVFKL